MIAIAVVKQGNTCVMDVHVQGTYATGDLLSPVEEIASQLPGSCVPAS